MFIKYAHQKLINNLTKLQLNLISLHEPRPYMYYSAAFVVTREFYNVLMSLYGLNLILTTGEYLQGQTLMRYYV